MTKEKLNMMTKHEALRIKHISQYCEEIGKDCDNCLFQDCFSRNEIRTAKSILGDWEEKESNKNYLKF